MFAPAVESFAQRQTQHEEILRTISMPQNHAEPTAPYELRRPSPPPIDLPILPRPLKDSWSSGANENVPPSPMLPPSQDAPGPPTEYWGLTAPQLRAVMRERAQHAPDRLSEWRREDRQRAQPVLEFLYAGPCAAAKDAGFLRREGITMIVVANGMLQPGRTLPSVDRAAQDVGIEINYVPVTGSPAVVIGLLPGIIRGINHHLLSNLNSDSHEQSAPSPGKVLVTCEDGNGKAAMIAAAYLMAMFGLDVVAAARFVTLSRISSTFEAGAKQALVTWQGIVEAHRDHSTAERSQEAVAAKERPVTLKRGFNDAMEVDVQTGEREDELLRFDGRETFLPFRDRGDIG